MKYVKPALAALSFALVVAVPGQAQQARMRAPANGAAEPSPKAPIVLPRIPVDPARPLVGVWEGEMTDAMADGPMPYVLVIEFLNSAYSSYSVNPGGVVPHKAEKVTGTAFHWEQTNMNNNGTLMFDVALNKNGEMTGTMKLVNANFAPEPATLKLHRKNDK